MILLRITEYSNDPLRLSKHLIPRSASPALGERMHATVLYQTSWLKCHYNLQSSVSGLLRMGFRAVSSYTARDQLRAGAMLVMLESSGSHMLRGNEDRRRST
jgi:hypothetical protein